MLFNLFYHLNRHKVNKMLKESYLQGLNAGYKIGCVAGQAEARNRGAILGGARVDEDVAEILKWERF